MIGSPEHSRNGRPKRSCSSVAGSTPESVIDRRGQVRRAKAAGNRVGTQPVRLADQLTANDARAGKDGRENRRPVVAARDIRRRES